MRDEEGPAMPTEMKPRRSIGVGLRRVVDASMRAMFGLAVYKRQLRPSLWVAVAAYLVAVAAAMWLAAGRPMPCILPGQPCSWPGTLDAMTELARAFASVMSDVAVVAMLAVLFLGAYRSSFGHAVKHYQKERLKEVAGSGAFPAVVARLPDGCEVTILLEQEHFQFPAALQCTIDTSALSSETILQSTQGGFDLAKLSLRGVAPTDHGFELRLGTCSFRDLNCAHYWAFVPIASESTDETEQRQKCLFDLIGPSQLAFARHVRDVVDGGSGRAPVALAPNPLGISLLIRVSDGDRGFWLLRKRAGHVAADQRSYCAAVAALVDVFPDFATSTTATVLSLMQHEFHDEVTLGIAPEYRRAFALDALRLEPLGFVFAPESNYQPELYYLATVSVDAWPRSGRTGSWDIAEILSCGRSRKGALRLVEDLDAVREHLRPRDRIAFAGFVPGALAER